MELVRLLCFQKMHTGVSIVTTKWIATPSIIERPRNGRGRFKVVCSACSHELTFVMDSHKLLSRKQRRYRIAGIVVGIVWVFTAIFFFMHFNNIAVEGESHTMFDISATLFLTLIIIFPVLLFMSSSKNNGVYGLRRLGAHGRPMWRSYGHKLDF